MRNKGGQSRKEKFQEENLINFLSNKNFFLKKQKNIILQNEKDIKKIKQRIKHYNQKYIRSYTRSNDLTRLGNKEINDYRFNLLNKLKLNNYLLDILYNYNKKCLQNYIVMLNDCLMYEILLKK